MTTYEDHNHGESIYNLIPPKMSELPKVTLYRSKIDWRRPPSASTFHSRSSSNPLVSNIAGDALDKIVPDKDAHTFGKPRGHIRNMPESYLKKATRSFSVPSLREVKMKNPELLKPSHLKPLSKKVGVPKLDERPFMNLVTSKNFIVANAVEVILADPKLPPKEGKDYMRKDDYGQVPKYLKHIKKDIEAEYDYIRMLDEDARRPVEMRPIDQNERLVLIQGLKSKWEKVNKDYQGFTHITKLDSAGQKLRKEAWDSELQNIEKDIELLNKDGLLVDMTR